MGKYENKLQRGVERSKQLWADPAYRAKKRVYDHERYLMLKKVRQDRGSMPPPKPKLTMEERKRRWKEQETARRRRRAADNRQYIRELKLAGKCIDCGFSEHPYALEFDHVEGPKLFDISRLSRKTRATLERELAKCVLRCANCHRMRTAKWDPESRW